MISQSLRNCYEAFLDALFHEKLFCTDHGRIVNICRLYCCQATGRCWPSAPNLRGIKYTDCLNAALVEGRSSQSTGGIRLLATGWTSFLQEFRQFKVLLKVVTRRAKFSYSWVNYLICTVQLVSLMWFTPRSCTPKIRDLYKTCTDIVLSYHTESINVDPPNRVKLHTGQRNYINWLQATLHVLMSARHTQVGVQKLHDVILTSFIFTKGLF